MKKIAIIGSGKVGQATGKGLIKKGHEVKFYDINEDILRRLNQEGLKTAHSLGEVMKEASIVFICIPNYFTFNTGNEFVFSELEVISREIAKYLDRQLIVIRSTALPGTTRKLSSIISPEQLIYNPEFLREKTAFEDFLDPERIVIGVEQPYVASTLRDVYRKFDRPICETSWEIAELVKLVSNVVLATKISLFNEAWIICQKLGIDADEVAKIVALDKRIGSYGINGGMPFGGKCLPKDLQGLIQFCEKSLKFNPEILKAVQRMNDRISAPETLGKEVSR